MPDASSRTHSNQRQTSSLQLVRVPLHLLLQLLDIIHNSSGLFEVTEQNSQEEIQHHEIPNNHQKYEVNCRAPAYRVRSVEHHLVPILPHQHYENSDNARMQRG